MKKDVYIEIKSTQQYSDDKESMQEKTRGVFYKKDEKFYLIYEEKDSGIEKSQTTLKISPDGSIAIIRTGSVKTNMVFKENESHNSVYLTPYGKFDISVTTNKLKADINENNLNIELDYTMEIKGMACSQNHLSLSAHA